MGSTDIGREAKVCESLWSGGNESKSSDHIQDFYNLYTIYNRSRSRNRMKFVIVLTRTV